MRRCVLLSVMILAGCSDKLETGYEPRKLGASDVARRGYYAPQFSPAAKAAAMDREREMDARRPKPGY